MTSPESKEEFKLLQYTDNTTMPPTDDDSITEDFKTFYPDKCASRTKINRSKCKGLFCGAFCKQTDQF